MKSQPLAGGGSVPFSYTDGYDLFSGRICLDSIKNDWSVFLWAKNLTNVGYITDWYQGFFGSIVAIRGMPRTFGIGLRYRY
jgi:outer membrane receptor protein involved in Fe transport